MIYEPPKVRPAPSARFVQRADRTVHLFGRRVVEDRVAA